MDRLGYDSFWMAEHHFQREGNECIGNLLMLYMHLAHITKNLKFGCGFNIAPMWHPLRLAEDFATVDILTKGRVIFGVGRGYHSREVDTFGAPSTLTDSDANRELFEEAGGGDDEGLQRKVLLPSRQVLHHPATGALPGL